MISLFVKLLIINFLGILLAGANPFKSLRELDIGARASLTYDSNLFGVSNQVFQSASTNSPAKDELESQDDFILNFTPTVHFSKKIYLLEFTGSAGVSVTRFIKNSDKSFIVPVTNFSIDFDETLSKGKRISNNAKIRFDASFEVGQHIDTSIIDQDLVSYTYFTTNLNLRYNHSAKFGVGAGTNFSFRNYQSGSLENSYTDLTSLPLSLRAFYIYSEKLDIYSDYTFTKATSGASMVNAADSSNHAISLGLNGEYSSKLSGNIGLGYSWINYEKESLQSDDNFVTSLNLSWVHNSKTSSTYSISRNFAPSAQGSSNFSTNIGVGVNHKLTDRLRGSANTNYSVIEYTLLNGSSTKLDQFGLGFGVDYSWSDKIMIGSSYSFSLINNKKESYDRHTIELFASGRF